MDKAPLPSLTLPSPIGRGVSGELLKWCVYAGVHPRQDGWLMLFRFANGLQASVVYGMQTRGIEVGVMNGEWLIDVMDDLSGDDVCAALFEVMKRSLA